MKKALIIIYIIIVSFSVVSCQMNADFGFIKPILNSVDGQGEPG